MPAASPTISTMRRASAGPSARPRFDWATLIRNKDKEIDRLEGIYRANLEKAGVEIVDSRAVIEDAHTVHLAQDGQPASAPAIILVAVGAHPTLEPVIPGGELGITSNEVFHLESLPKRILVVGGGYIAVEFAGVFAGLGSEVTLLHRGDKLLRGFDEDVRDALGEAYAQRGIKLALGRTVARLDKTADGIAATLSDGSVVTVDQVLVATGRRPNTDGLGLEKAGITVDEVGRHPGRRLFADPHAVDLRRRRRHQPGQPDPHRHPRGPRLRRHGVRQQAHHGRPRPDPDRRLLDAGDRRHRLRRGGGPGDATARSTSTRPRFRPMKATLSGAQRPGAHEAHRRAGRPTRCVGVHIVGHDAGEMIQLAGIAVTMGATKADFDRTVAVHPTAAEELVTMRTPVVVKKPVAVG